jgi:hypothetical protein
MFILQKDNQTFYGPNQWNPKLIQAYIEDEFELEMNISSEIPTTGSNIGNDIFVYKVIRTDIPVYNTKTQKLNGPFYTIENNEAIQYFTAIDKSVSEVQTELKQVIAHNRWIKEVSGILVNIQGESLKITTQRVERDIFQQGLQSGVQTNWKLTKSTGEIIWLILPTTDLQIIVDAILAHITACFSWEKSKFEEIENSGTLELLDGIILEME